MKYIRKDYSGVVPNGKILNQEVNSATDTYSTKYINEALNVKLNKTSIKNEVTESELDTYSTSYINKNTEIIKISNEDFIDLNAGFSIPTSSLYKQGKHIFGYMTIQKNSNFLGTSENIGTLKIVPNQFINMFGVSGEGTDVYSIPTGQAHIYIQGNGILLAVVKSTESYIKFYIDYVTN